MTSNSASPDPLQEQYGNLTEIERRPEGVWYAGSLRDGILVSVLTLAPGIVERITRPKEFFAELQRTADARWRTAAGSVGFVLSPEGGWSGRS